MKINMKTRIKSKEFWIALIPAVIVLVQVTAAIFGYTLDFTELSGKLVAFVDALFMVLAICGIINDPNVAGFGDSKRALGYDKPYVEKE